MLAKVLKLNGFRDGVVAPFTKWHGPFSYFHVRSGMTEIWEVDDIKPGKAQSWMNIQDLH